ncbi:hypothetical protein RND81_02G018000 [Saponaria officinalis]|uniref:Bifunctional inhibitor/plant lipid transfer protein/seed storage helical domain-containing protein n=1 Tax=Saponaria officinalis TaxID=3572 RepID=A0AAW1MQ25_SAPOF
MEIMGKKLVSIILAISTIMVIIMAQRAEAQDVCGKPASVLLPCLASVRQPNPPSPSPQCCDGLKTMDVQCLCGYVSSPLLPVYGIDKNLALALPGKCGIQGCA